MKNGICTLRAAVSQPILLLLPRSFVTERLREKLCSCLVLHKSHRESLWSTDARENEGFSPSCIDSSLKEGASRSPTATRS